MNALTPFGPMLGAYLHCALWSSLDDDGEPLDAHVNVTDLPEDIVARCSAEMIAFLDEAMPILKTLPTIDYVRFGHDFWLTRNHHGCGFWDGDWPEPQATQLTELAHQAGERDFVFGDDGAIYLTP